MTWEEYMDEGQYAVCLSLKYKIESMREANGGKDPFSKNFPVKITYFWDSSGDCFCPVCGEDINLTELLNSGHRCKHCNQLYDVELFIS